MEGALSLAEHLNGILPMDALFVLGWNPPQLTVGQESEAGPNTHTIGYTRPAAFYDRHLAPHLILERVVYFDTLVSTMGNTVDRAIRDAVTKRPLPEDTGMLLSEKAIKHQVRGLFRRTKMHETGVAEAYLKHAATYCLPIASTLAIHPSSEHWDSILNWTTDVAVGRWEIADGALLISTDVFKDDQWRQELLQNEDDWKNSVIEKLSSRSATLAVWEMKSLTVGTAEVMKEIVKMGVTHAKFSWKKCTLSETVCKHRFWKGMEESKDNYNPGLDARSPPWTLPDVPLTSAAVNPRPTSLYDHLRSASAQGGTTSTSYRESSSSVEDGEGVAKKRHHDSDAPEYEQPALKKSKAQLMDEQDESYEPPPGVRKEATAQSFLQQTWAEAVRNRCTVMIMHSGNHEIIGIRHRKTRTLYISHLIEPHSCSDPAYGKIQVGIYIAAVQETIERARQDQEAREERANPVSLRNEEANPNGDHSPKGPTTPQKRGQGSRSKGKQYGKQGGNEKRHASGKEIDNQVLLDAARQNRLCLRFFYDIYDSPHPATFRRVPDESKEAARPAKPVTPPPSPERRATPLFGPSIHITVRSELHPGSTGIVHIGTMAVGQAGPGPTTQVAVKLAFSRDEKSRLMEEHEVYSYLRSKCVQGIPRDIGLFIDEEPLLDAEGPYALVTSYVGVSLFGMHPQDFVKDPLLETLRSIHNAGVLHGDIQISNICVNASGEASLVDFSHASKGGSQEEKDREIQDLAHILNIDFTESTAKDFKDVEKAEKAEKVLLRRSSRIREIMERKSKVEP